MDQLTKRCPDCGWIMQGKTCHRCKLAESLETKPRDILFAVVGFDNKILCDETGQCLVFNNYSMAEKGLQEYNEGLKKRMLPVKLLPARISKIVVFVRD